MRIGKWISFALEADGVGPTLVADMRGTVNVFNVCPDFSRNRALVTKLECRMTKERKRMRKHEKRARLRSNLKASRKACCHEGA